MTLRPGLLPVFAYPASLLRLEYGSIFDNLASGLTRRRVIPSTLLSGGRWGRPI
jgi:hypothetical protein